LSVLGLANPLPASDLWVSSFYLQPACYFQLYLPLPTKVTVFTKNPITAHSSQDRNFVKFLGVRDSDIAAIGSKMNKK
jgi:hypothetical protein